MSTRWFCGTFIIVGVVLTLGGYKSLHSGASPAPTPTPQPAAAPKQAASAIAPRTVGHTEINDIAGHHRANDDGDHCFKKDNSRDLVLTFTDDAVKSGKVSALLIDVVNGPVDDVPTITKDPNDPRVATITFSDAISKRRASDPRLHLGPGPYVEVTTVDVTGAPGANAAGPKLPPFDIFPYITVNDPKTQCP